MLTRSVSVKKKIRDNSIMDFHVMSLGGRYVIIKADDRDDMLGDLDLDFQRWDSLACIVHRSWWVFHIEDVVTGDRGTIKFTRDGDMYHARSLGRYGFGLSKEVAIIDLMYKFASIKKEFLRGGMEDCFINLFNH